MAQNDLFQYVSLFILFYFAFFAIADLKNSVGVT